ncbi:hypothetical protein CEE39_07055 [bacterium (candidate division B38) B3_B38]|nr:MAG: hypothetical protein CEE39_07055 [bacterium (candidate division B38) B3_B38]
MEENPILIIGEEPYVVKKVEAAVANLGYPCHTAKSFDQAYQFLTHQKPLMIITEAIISGRSWIDFFNSMAGIPPLFAVPTICMLTEKELIGLIKAQEFRADDYLIKPFRLREARARIQALLMLGKRLPPTSPLGGELEDMGLIALLKLVERNGLSGRLQVSSEKEKGEFLFLQGDVVSVMLGGLKGREALEQILPWKEGNFILEIEEMIPPSYRGMKAIKQTPSAKEELSSEPLIPLGDLSQVEYEGEVFQVQTEFIPGETPTLTTLILRGGEVVRKIKRQWEPGTIDIGEEKELVRQQHNQIVDNLQQGGTSALETSILELERSGDYRLLLKAVELVYSHMRQRLGSFVSTTYLLYLKELLTDEYPYLAEFGFAGNRVILSGLAARRPELVEAEGVSRWLDGFINKCASIARGVDIPPLEELTSPLRQQLQRIDFYSPG